jgi:hypothetical protein
MWDLDTIKKMNAEAVEKEAAEQAQACAKCPFRGTCPRAQTPKLTEGEQKNG